MLRRATRRTPCARFLGASLAVLLAAPGPGLNAFASEPDPAPSAAALSVASDPAGASVYIDGALAGATPVTVEDVPTGQHRVRVVKDGYLENSRVVSVKPGQGETVQVRMTPAAGQARHTVQQDPDTTGGGGGSKKVLWIALGVAAVGAGAYFLLKDSNDPPSAGNISISPAGTGMAGATSFTVSAQGASDPDGDTLTYSWNFGDGATGSGQSTSHTYASEGTFSVALTVSDGEESATANGSVTVARNMAGTWSGGREPGFNSNVSLSLNQSGGSLTGSVTFSGNVRGTLTGLTGSVDPLAYPNNVTWQSPSFTLTNAPGSFRLSFTGGVDGSGNIMNGTITMTSTALRPPSVSGSTSFRR